MMIVKDVAQLGNGRIKQADRLTINAKDVAPLENGQMKLVAPRTINVNEIAPLENGQTKQDFLLIASAKVAPPADSTHEPDTQVKLTAKYVLVGSSPTKLAQPNALVVLLDSSILMMI